jgi:hypothetical protein
VWYRVQYATNHCTAVVLDEEEEKAAVPPRVVAPPPAWLPRDTEELCYLTGTWRILHRVGLHRWTTNDLVTAAAAARAVLEHNNHNYHNTATWARAMAAAAAAGSDRVVRRIQRAVGFEAQAEAVGLARRSLKFYVGNNNNNEALLCLRKITTVRRQTPMSKSKKGCLRRSELLATLFLVTFYLVVDDNCR